MAENKLKLSKVWKWIIGVCVALIIIIGALTIYINIRWKPVLTEKIKEGVYNATEHLYRIDFKDIHLNIFSGSATLDSVVLMPDSAGYEVLKQNKLAPVHVFHVELDRLEINRAGLWNAYFKKKLDIKSIVLKKPSINMIYRKVPVKDDTDGQKTPYEMIASTFKSLRVHQVKVIDADFDYISGKGGSKRNSIKKLNIIVDDIYLDSLSHLDSTRFYNTKDISFQLLGYTSLTKDKMYTLKVDTLLGSAAGKSIQVKGFRMVPMLGDLAFTRKFKVQKDRYDLDFKAISFAGVNFLKLNQTGDLHAKSVTVGPAEVAIFMNRELPPPGFDKGRNYPHMALRRLSQPIQIDTLILKQVNVAYTEYNPETQKRGTVNLDNLQGTVRNVTNDSLQLTKNSHAIANLSTRIIKAANIDIHIDFNLLSKNGQFSYSGKIGPMNMTELNPLSRNLGLVKIDQGSVQKADFNISANFKGSKGTMRFYYRDLKVTMLKAGEDGGPAKEKGLLSFLANAIIIKDANPTPGEDVRTANITLERTPAASFFNLLWKSVFVGIRETVGIGVIPVKSPEQAYKKVADKVKDDKEDKKAERKRKREQRREERREERAQNQAEGDN
ncbi:hypothetical protein [Pedobacter sp.]|uniref:hypothetical protein n=1 Tax=Pedobacter sp. TaxID=1411316 RepID=UPI003D7F9804